MWIILSLVCLAIGLVIGLQLPIVLPPEAIKYVSIAILASFDSVFGGIRSHMEESFDLTIFLSGFFANSILAAAFAYLGDRLGLELYLAVAVVFAIRVLQNLAIIRRYLLKKN